MYNNRKPKDAAILTAYSVPEAAEGEKPFWTRIGRAFQHKDGKGFEVRLGALPVGERIVIREEQPRKAA